MELGDVDASGRRRPVPVNGSEFITEYNSVIGAIGQIIKIPEKFSVKTGRGDVIHVHDDSITSRQGVFAGGDVVTSPASVISAIASGRKGAIAIDKFLGGKGIIDEELAPVEEPEVRLGFKGDFAHLHRSEIPCIAAGQRLSSFTEVEQGYDEKAALKEAYRCLKCDVRLKIHPVQLPPKRQSLKKVG